MLPQVKDLRKNIWEKFIADEPINTSFLRPEVLESWHRCKGKVDPFKEKNTDILSPEDFEKLKIKYRELIDVAVPTMQNFYNFVKDSGFSIVLIGIDGENHFFLEVIGDSEQLAEHQNANAIPGSNWSEHTMGTAAAHLAVYHDRPFIVYPNENWLACLKNITTCAAPIHQPETHEIIGSLTLAACYTQVQSHTLGMVVAAVDSIERQMTVRHLARKTEIAHRFKSVIMECVSDGLIAIDEFGSIIHVNHKALNILGFEQEPVGRNIFEVFNRTYGKIKGYRDLANVINSRESVTDQFVNIDKSGEIIRCVVSTRLLETNGELMGKILIIQQMSRAAKLVTRALGNYARFTFSDIIGQDQKLHDCIKIGMKVAKTSSNVLILGESGTGKDLFAQAIHNASSRNEQPFFAINCAAIPRELLGSELFGYVEGAFTGAKKGGSPGKFELADGGTIFLDEIGEMPLEMQTSFLRVLEEKAVTRIGDKIAIPVDVRIIAATNKDLAKEVKCGNFRADLYYRINVVTIEAPPLRDRIGDITWLTDHFVRNLAERMGKRIDYISPEVYQICSQHEWPGNIRELQNVIERAVNLADGNVLSPDLLPQRLTKMTEHRPANFGGERLKSIRRTTEHTTILGCVEKYKGNMTLAAKELGIARSTLYRKFRELQN